MLRALVSCTLGSWRSALGLLLRVGITEGEERARLRILVGTGRPIVAIVAIPMLSMDDHTPRGGASTNDLSCERSSVYKSRKPVERGDIGVAIERLSQIITLIS